MDEILATVDIAVVAEVTSVTVGPTVAEGQPYERTHYAVELAVEEVIKGVLPGDTLVVKEPGINAEGRPFELADLPWSYPGDRGVFLLAGPEPETGLYYYLSAEGRIFIEAAKEFSEPTDNNAMLWGDSLLADEIRTLAAADVVVAVRASMDRVAASDMEPVKPFYQQISDGDISAPDTHDHGSHDHFDERPKLLEDEESD